MNGTRQPILKQTKTSLGKVNKQTGLSAMTFNNILGHLATSHPPHHHSFPLQWSPESLTKAAWDLTESVSFTKAIFFLT